MLSIFLRVDIQLEHGREFLYSLFEIRATKILYFFLEIFLGS